MFITKYAVFRGRFQPFHLGHLQRCKELLNLHEVLVLGIVVVKPDVSANELPSWLDDNVKKSIVDAFRVVNNPFTYLQVYEMIKECLLEEKIEHNRFSIVPHFTPLVYSTDMEMLFMPPKSESTLYVGRKSEHNIFGADYYQNTGWNVVSEPVLSNKYNATTIRIKLDTGESILDLVHPAVARFMYNNYKHDDST